ncbi:MAG TPA: transglycosylase family protein [Solirubrobacterales bacterium]
MLTKRTYFIPVLIACIAFPAVALATTGDGPAPPRVGVADAVPIKIGALQRPVARFHKTISATVKRMEAKRRAEARRERRELYATLPGGVSQETLEAIAACESGGDPTIVSSDGTYRGKYQFSISTWESVGGSGDPAAAPEQEQDYRAALLYAASGSSPWPICG